MLRLRLALGFQIREQGAVAFYTGFANPTQIKKLWVGTALNILVQNFWKSLLCRSC
jgi:hypothetical protein